MARPKNDTTEVVTVAAPASNDIVDELQTMGPAELGRLIGRTQKSIKVDCHRRPETLPPRFIIPGTRKLLWRVKDVRDWMDALAEIQAERRRQIIELARKVGIPPNEVRASPRVNIMGHKGMGLAANARMARKQGSNE